MERTLWTPERVHELMHELDERYFDGSLGRYGVILVEMEGILGHCIDQANLILVDTKLHVSDSEVQDTLLHVMTHAADPNPNKRAHGDSYFECFEEVLRRGGRNEALWPTLPFMRTAEWTVPASLRLCTRAVEALRRIEWKRYGLRIPNLDPDDKGASFEGLVKLRFADAAIQGYSWRDACWALGIEYGLINSLGEPLIDEAETILFAYYEYTSMLEEAHPPVDPDRLPPPRASKEEAARMFRDLEDLLRVELPFVPRPGKKNARR